MLNRSTLIALCITVAIRNVWDLEAVTYPHTFN